MPVLSERAPRDYFLLVGNDNDFLTRQGVINGQPYDAGINNDNILLAYRLTLPTYVDPLSLAVMKETAPTVLQGGGRRDHRRVLGDAQRPGSPLGPAPRGQPAGGHRPGAWGSAGPRRSGSGATSCSPTSRATAASASTAPSRRARPASTCRSPARGGGLAVGGGAGRCRGRKEPTSKASGRIRAPSRSRPMAAITAGLLRAGHRRRRPDRRLLGLAPPGRLRAPAEGRTSGSALALDGEAGLVFDHAAFG